MGKLAVGEHEFSQFISVTIIQGGYQINFEHSDLEFDEKLINLDISMKRVEDKTVVNLRGEIHQDITDPIIFKVSQYEKVGAEYQHFVNSSVSACNVLGRFKAHPIMKIVLKELLKSSSIPTACPIKKVSKRTF
jgi:Protein of unknown function (DUF1091)